MEGLKRSLRDTGFQPVRSALARAGSPCYLALFLILGGCAREHPQTTFLPSGPAAREIDKLWWFLFYLCSAIFIVTMLLTLLAMLRRRLANEPGPPLGTKFVIITGIFISAVILFVLQVFSLRTTVALAMPQTAFTIRVIGHQWWWEIEYPDHGILTANELHIPVGVPVRLELKAFDVIHSFWVPRLHGKMDLLPEHANIFWIQADEPGTYRGQCAEYCGVQHALMAFNVIALPADEFEQWASARRASPAPPTDERLRRGRDVFVAKCSNCHAIRGVTDRVRTGPDLTHIASRSSLGAGTLPNTRGYLMGWIADPQPLKPGNRMPRSYLTSEELHTLVEYLETLH